VIYFLQMIYPIVAIGDPVLRKKCKAIDSNYADLITLEKDMFKTMYAASGVGLAAPQIGLDIRLFVIDASPFADDDDLSDQERTTLANLKKTFINAQLIDENGEFWRFNEGCLSIPNIREDVSRQSNITIKYQDINFQEHVESYTGLAARVIQHEYDHIEGVLFTDKLSSFKKRLLKKRIQHISSGQVKTDYKMRFSQ